MPRGEVGQVGVAVSCLADMEILFDGIPLDQVTTSMTINGPAIVALGDVPGDRREARHPRWTSWAARFRTTSSRSTSRRRSGSFRRGPALRIVVDMIDFCAPQDAALASVSISGYHIREAGATAVQELAFTLADGIWLRPGLRRCAASTVDVFAPRLSFFCDVHNDFFEEIAKFRAARRIWARVMRDVSALATSGSSCSLPTARPPACQPHRPAALQQRGAHDASGAGGRAGRHAVAAHQLAGRDDSLADRGAVTLALADAADHCPRERAWIASSTRSAAATTSKYLTDEWRARLSSTFDASTKWAA